MFLLRSSKYLISHARSDPGPGHLNLAWNGAAIHCSCAAAAARTLILRNFPILWIGTLVGLCVSKSFMQATKATTNHHPVSAKFRPPWLVMTLP